MADFEIDIQSFDIQRTVSVYPDRDGIVWWTKAWFNGRKKGERAIEITRALAIKFIHDDIQKESTDSSIAIMANNRDIFTSTVVPIMDKVRDDLQRKQADEYERHSRSLGALMAGAAGPDGGMAAMDAYSERLYYIGEWNSKTVDDYIEMVKTELKNKGVVIDAVLEKKMIDHLIEQQMPKSTAEYILRKAAEGSIFYLPQRARTTALQDHINNEGDKRHNPSLFEDVTSTILSWASNAASTGGIGGFWGQAALDVAVEGGNHVAGGKQEKHLARQRELGRQEVAAASKQKVAIPKWMLTQMGFERIGEATDQQLAVSLKWANANAANYRNAVNKALDRGERTVKSAGKTSLMSVSEATLRAMQYEAFAKSIGNEQKQRKEQEQQTTSYSSVAEAEEHPLTTMAANTVPQERTDGVSTGSTQQTSEQTQPMLNFTGNFSGWNSLLDSIGMSGSGDTFRHLGVTLATLPDMLLGLFTGRTKSLGLNKSTMMPLAALIGGSFIKNPLLKIPLMLYGGASLVNKVGQEALSEYRQETSQPQNIRYRQYADEELNPRISNPHVEGNVLIVDIDHVPRIVTMPPTLADAYQSGAIPLNTLANHILAKTDQMQQSSHIGQQAQDVARQYEQGQEREQVRGIR